MEQLQQATAALQAGDPSTAARIVADALFADPRSQPAQSLAYQIVTSTGDPVGLTALGDSATIAQAALHAFALSIAHQFTPAMEILFNIAAQRPAVPVLEWVQQWVDQHPASQLVELEVVGPAISGYTGSFDDPVDPEDPRHANLVAGHRVVARLHETFNQPPPLSMQVLKLLRLAKRFDEALAFAAQQQQRDPFLGLMMQAWTHRDREDPEAAKHAFMSAYQVRPDPAIMLDVGDLQLSQGDFAAAAASYGGVPPDAEEYGWAHPHAVAAAYLQTRDPARLAELATLANDGSEAAEQILDRITLFADRHELPKDLTIGLVRDVVRRLIDDPGQQTSPDSPANFKVTISNPESPSVFACHHMAMAMLGEHVDLQVNVESIPTPDPRLPLEDALGAGPDPWMNSVCLWRFDGTNPIPAVAPPPPEIAAAVANLAASDISVTQWLRRAAEVAPALRDAAPQLAAVMVHPPPPPSPDVDVGEWLYKVQLAAACMLARIDTGWAQSWRRVGLLGLAHGAIDWPIAVVIPVLEHVAAEEPSARDEIRSTFERLHQRVPPEGYTCYRLPLYACWFRLPDLDDATRKEVWARYDRARRKPYL